MMQLVGRVQLSSQDEGVHKRTEQLHYASNRYYRPVNYQ